MQRIGTKNIKVDQYHVHILYPLESLQEIIYEMGSININLLLQIFMDHGIKIKIQEI